MISVEVLSRSKYSEITRVRRLSTPGNVLVSLGDTVHPSDVIAEASTPTQVQILDIARGLGVSPSQAASCMMRDLGEVVQQGDVIAQNEGNLPRLVRAPVGGKLLDWQNGSLTLVSGGQSELVKAGMIGEVSEIILNIGAVLRTQGCLIQGIWGNDRAGSGSLTLLDSNLETQLDEAELDTLEQGQMLAVGHCSKADCFPLLVEKDLTGLILCSLAPELIHAAVAQPFPIVLLQGFGQIPPDPLSVSLLCDCAGEEVSINACGRDKIAGDRPEVIIPLSDGDFEEEMESWMELEMGQWVQVSAGVALGQTGEVIAYSSEDTQFESGIKAPSTRIRLHNNEEITVPSENLVILSHSKLKD